jgi:hypothetical protein
MKRPKKALETEETVAGFWAWIMGLGVVFIAIFGTVIFAKVDPAPASNDNGPTVADTQQTSFGGMPLPPPDGGKRAYSRHEARADVIALVNRRQPIPSQDMLSDRWGVPKGTTSRWLDVFEAEGLVRRQVAGRYKIVRAA